MEFSHIHGIQPHRAGRVQSFPSEPIPSHSCTAGSGPPSASPTSSRWSMNSQISTSNSKILAAAHVLLRTVINNWLLPPTFKCSSAITVATSCPRLQSPKTHGYVLYSPQDLIRCTTNDDLYSGLRNKSDSTLTFNYWPGQSGLQGI